MATKRPLLGLCPIGKFVFSHEDALRYKRILQSKLRSWNIPFTDLEGVLPDGIIRDQSHAEVAVKHFKSKGIDAVFMPHCNFGTEGAVGIIGRDLGVPLLLWGPRDGAPEKDGKRKRDTLCGLFASSKVLYKLGVPFTYVENCEPDDAKFKTGMETFLGAANVANGLRKGMRIGHIGARIDFFWTTIVNEAELLQKFHIEVLPMDMVTFCTDVKKRVVKDRAKYVREAKEFKAKNKVIGFKDDEPLIRILAVRDEMLARAEQHKLDGLAVQDFTSLVDEMGTYCFHADGMVSETVPVSLESDIHGAVSTVLMHRAAQGMKPTFLAEFTTRHPKDDNGVLIWHAGAPPSMCKPGAKVTLGHHWILPSPLAGMTHFPLKDGPLTVTRFDGDHGNYKLAVGEGKTMPGPFTQNNYLWMKVDDWPHWERTLMEGPFIHHCAMAYGNYGAALAEACRYVPGLELVRLNK